MAKPNYSGEKRQKELKKQKKKEAKRQRKLDNALPAKTGDASSGESEQGETSLV
jgi:hypothetical protein